MNERRLTADEYRILVEHAPILIWRSNTAMQCDYFNETWLAFTGRSLAQELGDGWAEGVHPDDLAGCAETWHRSFEQRVAFEMHYRLRRHDGAWRWIFDRGQPCFVEGVFTGYIGSCVDVNDRVEVQRERLKARRDEWAAVGRLLPLCCHCHRIRDGQGEWIRLEKHLTRDHETSVTHSICPTCLEEHYPEDSVDGIAPSETLSGVPH